MSFDVNAYPSTAYRQTPVAWPVKLFNPPAMKPASVVLTFDWLVYFTLMVAQLGAAPNIAVDIDINSGGTSQGPVLDKIVTAKIDNSNSFVPILIFFPDSGDVVTCPPQTVATLPCCTNGSLCKVIAQGLSAGNLPMTKITFYNYFVPPSVDPVIQVVYPQWIGSPAIQRSNLLTPGYGPPALGDQTMQYDLDLAGPPNKTVNGIFGTPKPSGLIFLTQVHVVLIAPLVGTPRNTTIRLATNTDQLYAWTYFVNNSIPAPGFFKIYDSENKQIKLDATKNWFFQNVDGLNGLVSGTATLFADWAYQP